MKKQVLFVLATSRFRYLSIKVFSFPCHVGDLYGDFGDSHENQKRVWYGEQTSVGLIIEPIIAHYFSYWP